MKKINKIDLCLAIIYPIFVLALQYLKLDMMIIVLAITSVLSIIIKSYKIVHLYLCTTMGHFCWLYIFNILEHNLTNISLLKVLNRFGLFGYIIAFYLIFNKFIKYENYFHIGDFKSKIKMPFIYYGKEEKMSRFLLIFINIWIIPTIFFSIKLSLETIVYGIAFSLINALLEEIIWRGFILYILSKITNDYIGIILSAISFGFYHISLGFNIIVCLAFAVGGFFFAGVTIKSKGLLSSFLMHLTMNLFFVSIGIIF